MDWLTSLHESLPAATEHDETSPFLVEFFMVEGIGFQCMAYRDFEGKWYRQEQDFFFLRVGSPVVRSDALTQEEAAVVTGYRWWTITELESTKESFYPVELPRLLHALTS